MRVPPFEELVELRSPDILEYGAEPFVATDDGRLFVISALGARGTLIWHTLPEGGRLEIYLGLGQVRRLPFLPLRGRSWFNLSFLALEQPEHEKVELARELIDTDQLEDGLGFGRLAPIVEAAFHALHRVGPSMTAQYHTARNLAAVRQLAKEAARAARLAGDLAPFAGAELVPGTPQAVPPLSPELTAAIEADREDGRRGVVVDAGNLSIQPYYEVDHTDYKVIAGSLVKTFVPGTSFSSGEPTLHEALLQFFRRDLASGKLRDYARIEYASQRQVFARLAEITDPGWRGLAATLLRVHAAVEQVVLADAALAKSVEAGKRQAALDALTLARLDPVPVPIVGALARVKISLPILENRSRIIEFRCRPDGTWASDALVAVSRGKHGRKIYAEAIHFPPRNKYWQDPIDQAGLEAMDYWQIDTSNLREFAGRPATILGWIRTAIAPGGFVPTADRSLWDENYVSGNQAAEATFSRWTVDGPGPGA